MAKYAKTTAVYDPFTLEELWKPAEMATEAHYKNAAAIAEMEAKLAEVDKLDPTRDAEEYNKMNEYQSALQNASQELQAKGLNGRTFGNVISLSSLYNKEITPINKSILIRKEIMKNAANLKLQDGSIEFAVDPTNLTLKQASQYGETYIPPMVSGEKVKSEVKEIITNKLASLENELTLESGANLGVNQKLYLLLKDQRGYGELIDKYLSGEEAKSQEEQMAFDFFNNTINSVLTKNQIDLLSDEQKERIKGYAHQGLSYGYGTTQNSLQQSDYYQSQELALRKRAEAREIKRDAEKPKDPAGISFAREPIATKPNEDYSKARNIFNKGKLKQEHGPYGEIQRVDGVSRKELMKAGQNIGLDFDENETTAEIYQKLGMKLKEYALTENVQLVSYDKIENIDNFINFYNQRNPNNRIAMPEGSKNAISFVVSPIPNENGTYMSIKQNGTEYPIDLSYTKAYSTPEDQELYKATASVIEEKMAENKRLKQVDGNVDRIKINNEIIEFQLRLLFDLFTENIKEASKS